MLVVRMKEAAQQWLNAQRVEIIAGGEIAEILGGRSARPERGTHRIVGHHAVEGAVPVAKIEIVGIGLRVPAMLLVLDVIEPLRIRNVEGAHDQRIQDSEDYDIRSNPQSQTPEWPSMQNQDASITGAGHISGRRAGRPVRPDPFFATAFLNEPDVAEGAACGLHGLFARHAIFHQIIGFLLQMLLNRQREVLIATTAEESS